MSKETLKVTGTANLTTSTTGAFDGTVSTNMPHYNTYNGEVLNLSTLGGTGSIGQSININANPNLNFNERWTPGYPGLQQGVVHTPEEIYQEVKNVEARIQQSNYELSQLKAIIQKMSDQTKVTKRDTPWG